MIGANGNEEEERFEERVAIGGNTSARPRSPQRSWLPRTTVFCVGSPLLLLLLLLPLLVALLPSEVEAACLFHERGIDHCLPCNKIAVKPNLKAPLPKPVIDMPPIGDNCYCKKMKTEPASLPKLCPKHQTANCNCYSSPAYLPSAPSKSCKDYSLPADPISIGLAVQAGKAISVPEAKLSYGFLRAPLDGLPRLLRPDVPEEDLYKLQNEIITLKRPVKGPIAEAEGFAEADTTEEEDDEVPIPENARSCVTYKQLGYTQEHLPNPLFLDLPPIPPKPTCENVDLKPGRIVPIPKFTKGGYCNTCHSSY